MPINLSKGQKVDLTKGNPGLTKIMVGLGWDVNSFDTGGDFDLDAAAFLLGESGKVTSSGDFVFYGNLKHSSGAVEHLGDNLTGEGDGDDEQIMVDLAKVPANIERIAFTCTIYDAENRRQNFGQVSNAFIRIVDSMVAQHAKWLKVCNQLPWRQKIASLNYVLSSNVWQQDHNGFTHQDPGFLDHVANKKADVVRLYLPPDANCLLSCFDHCIKSRNYVNVMVASKHPRPQWLTMEQAVKHCTQGIGIWQWASNDQGCEPDVVMACCGDTPTLETLAAVTILRHYLPDLKIRVVNVVDLMKLQPHTAHPHGLTDEDYDVIFTRDKPIIFAFHGYPSLVHELTYRRHNKNIHVLGYREEGTITTPFDMRVQNDIDRFDLVIDTVKRLPQLGNTASYLIQEMQDKLVEHRQYITTYGQDLPEVRDWKWNDGKGNY